MKRRTAKARMTAEDEATFWGDFWDCGGFLLAGWDQVLGVVQVTGPEDWRELERSPEVVGAAREAWKRLGAEYMAGRLDRRHRDFHKRGRWALEQFGEPG